MSTVNHTCQDCGQFIRELEDLSTHVCPEVVSDVGDTLDALVAKASIPNLAALFKRGKDAGLIKPGKDYGNQT